MRLWCWCVVALAACTKPNPEVCCLDAADCASIGVTDPERACTEGLACVNNACVVPSCSTDGCSAEAPVCDLTLDVCTGCTGPADCDQFDTKVCDTGRGSCVECVVDLDCEPTSPICDATSCRGCRVDSECTSGACGDDGVCLNEAEIVYLSPTGADIGTCDRLSPCKGIEYAASTTSLTRFHLTLAPGTYANASNSIQLDNLTTSASKLTIHGGGATVLNAGGDGPPFITLFVPTTIRDLTIQFSPFGPAIFASSPTILERVNLKGAGGIRVQGSVTLNDAQIEATSGIGIDLQTGSLDVTNTIIHGGTSGLVAAANTTFNAMNVIVHSTSDAGIRVPSPATGVLNHVTVANTGSSSPDNAGLFCSTGVQIRGSIIWTPNTSKTTANASCNFVSSSTSIVGPNNFSGGVNIDPMFVAPNNGDFHLGMNSPAIDLLDDGPAVDFERDARPRGVRFDLGADER